MSPENFPIESDIPYPGPQKISVGRRGKYPFNMLEIGQSFFVSSKHTAFSKERTLCQSFHKARETTHKNFAWTKVEGGFRIYRLGGIAELRRRGSNGAG